MKNLILNFLICVDKKNRIGLLLLLFLMLISSFFEMIGVGFIPLFVSIIIKPDIIISFLKDFDHIFLLSIINSDNLLIYFCILIIIFYLFKNLFLVFILYLEQKLLLSITVSIQKKLFKSYLGQSYQEFSQINPSIIQNNLTGEVKRNIVFFTSSLKLLREFLVSFIIFLVFVFYDPGIIFLIIFILSFCSWIFYSFFKKIINKSSLNFRLFSERSLKSIIETIGSIREIKIFQNEINALNTFNEQIYIKDRETSFQSFFAQLPKVYLEIIVVAVFFILVFFIKWKYGLDDNVFIYLSFLAAAFIRFYPAFNIILSSLARIKANYLAFETLGLELNRNKKYINKNLHTIKNKNQIFDFSKLSIKNVYYKYPSSENYIFNNLNLDILKNEKIGFFGDSGSGKSTLFDLLSGLLNPNRGSINIDNVNIIDPNINWFNYIAYVSQDTFLTDNSILTNISLENSIEKIDLKKLEKSIKDSELFDFISNLKDGINSKVGHNGISLSGGQKQRIGIARALYRSNGILLLDEATSALDSKTEKKILENILSKQNKLTVFIISHRLSSLKGCDKIYQVVKGNIELKNKQQINN